MYDSRYLFQTTYSCTELLEALKSIKRMIQCCTCHKPLNSVRNCINGHVFCWNCRNRCNRFCPLCSEQILETKPAVLNDLVKLLPRSCNFVTKGCDSLVLPHDDEHENFCGFRRTCCRFLNCGWKGVAKSLLMHLEKNHGKEIIRTATRTTILMSFNAAIDKEGLAVIVAFNNIFWQHVRIRKNRLLQFYQYVPLGKPTNRYVAHICFHTQEASFSNSTPVHTDMFDPAQLFKDKETFSLPKKVALSFNKFHSGVHYTFKIIQVDI